MAPGVSEAALTQVMTYEAFDVGTPEVPRDMTAQIHKGEAIIPAKTAQAWRDGDLGMNPNGGGGSSLHIHAMDSKDVKRFLTQHGDTIHKILTGKIRGGSRAAFAGM